MKFDQDQMYHIYNGMFGIDSVFVKQLAEAAIKTALDVQTDLYQDAPIGSTPPDESDLRELAVQYSTDNIREFMTLLEKHIREMNFTANVQIKQQLTSDLKFN